MNTTKTVGCLCIFSTLLIGCYSSVLVIPTNADNVRANAGYIDYVVTEDGRKYEFEKPPVVINDSLWGEAKVTVPTHGGMAGFVNQEEASIPLSDLALVSKSNFGTTEYVVTKAGAKYTYDEPPTTVNGAVVGEAHFAGFTPMKTEVSIPLSDIQTFAGSSSTYSFTSPDELIRKIGDGGASVLLKDGRQYEPQSLAFAFDSVALELDDPPRQVMIPLSDIDCIIQLDHPQGALDGLLYGSITGGIVGLGVSVGFYFSDKGDNGVWPYMVFPSIFGVAIGGCVGLVGGVLAGHGYGYYPTVDTTKSLTDNPVSP